LQIEAILTPCNDSLINEQLTTHGMQLLYMVTIEILMHVSAYIMLHRAQLKNSLLMLSPWLNNLIRKKKKSAFV